MRRQMQGLSRIEWWLILSISIAVFLFAAGPMWERPFEIDAHIAWSYLVIPVLVGLFLIKRGRLRALPFIIGTTELVLIKFMITISFIAVPAWIAAGDPAKRERRTQVSERVEMARPQATPIAPEITGSIRGAVLDAAGRPLAKALVFVESGLEDYVFDPPDQPVRMSNDGDGASPKIAVLHPWQELLLVSTDEQLHVLAASDERGHPAFTLPMLAGGEERKLVLSERRGLFSLRCRVHERGESSAYLLLAAHPFHTTTDADGRFALTGIPTSQVTLRAWTATDQARAELLVRPGERHEVIIRAEPAGAPRVDPRLPKR